MANKKIWLGMLVIVLAFGMTVVSCDNGTTDTWTDITSLSQVDGTWKGSFTYTETEDGFTVRTNLEITQTINATAATMSGNVTIRMTFSGTGIAEAWPFIKEMFEEEGVVVNDSTRTITITEPLPSGPITLASLGDIQINQSGSKIKYPYSDDGEILGDIIFNKQ